MTAKRKAQKGKPKQSRAAMCDATARNLDTLVQVSGFEFITDMVVDAITDASARLDIEEPSAWFEPKTDDPDAGVEALARWLRRVPTTLSLRRPAVENMNETARRRIAARLLTDAVNTYGIPDFITNAIVTALYEACRANRLEPPAWLTEEDGDDRGDSLAALWERIPDMYDRELEPKRDLAQLISAVLKHPDTPRDIHHGIREALARLTDPDDVNEDPAVIAVALAVHKAEGEGGES